MSGKSYEKLIDQIGEMTVLELAEMVKALEDKFGVSAAPVAMAGSASAGEAVAVAEEKSEYKVTLTEAGSNPVVKVIKALREVVKDIPLGEAKKAVVEAPTVIAEAASKEDAKKMKEVLEAAGAKVELS
ncbi:MAG: large subunit ribosomal protein L7/L12 [Alteromonas naphthalenivorans]|jgi:large subunit ribosomal protein L7/L12